MIIQCTGCLKEFKSYRALSCHVPRCKAMAGVITTTARHYAGEFDGSRKRRRTSTPAGSGDEEQEDAEAIDFEVSFNVSVILLVSQGVWINSRYKNLNNPLPPSLKTTLVTPMRSLFHLVVAQGVMPNSL